MVLIMKTWVPFLVSLCLAGSVAGQTASTSTAKAAPGKSDPAGAAKKEEPAKIEGMEVSRGEKGYLGIQIVDGRFKIKFYDLKKKQMQPDVARAILRWDPKYKVGTERVLLTPGPENTLTSERFIRPPYNFRIFMLLQKEAPEGDDAVGESLIIDFRQ